MDEFKVLIVEDDPMVAEINKNFTEAVEGFSVAAVAKNGNEALNLLSKRSFDLVVLDNYLPEKSGIEVLAEIRRQERPIDVIMITAADDSVTITAALRYGVVAYIAKPFKFERYRAVLDAYRNFRQKSQKRKTLEQQDIDELFTLNQNVGTEAIPKNFNVQTLSTILNYMAAQTTYQSAEEIAAGVGISRVTARRYLEYLVEKGQVQRVMEYLSVGRPVHRFKFVENR
ncbi:MAG: response regulator receiver and unknown domain protein [Firmicutes bacterium]|nr:response regulator receiver and unknown domain protein [Bacillota bacterium]